MKFNLSITDDIVHGNNQNKPYIYHKSILDIIVKCAENTQNTQSI